ncbi:hypothetical protein ACFRJ1_21285 [Streptomyces sp. NPDC056773]|uniref:hypothetical protein n=1 Tax=unclassified Streptomyces TaxID=2593676 RepID=UPI0036CF0F8E
MGAGTEPDGSSRSDAEWEQFLRESVEGAADAPKEPSARARDVARRLRAEPAGGPPAWRGHTPARPKRRTGWYVVGLLATVALLLVALAPERIVDLFTGSDSPAPVAETTRPAGAPPTEIAQRPTEAEPFRGSPAADWASGAAGITVPEAAAVGWMSAAQVEQALAGTRDFLVASNLDRGVLRGERPEKPIAQINPHQKDVHDLVASGFRTPSKENDPLLLFSRFDPSRTRLVGEDVRTLGRLSYQEGERGALQVTADVTFVYPVTRADAGGGDGEIVRTIVRREMVLSWDNPAKVRTEPGTFSIVSYNFNMTNGGCGAPTGYLVPPFGKDRLAEHGGTEVDPYDRSIPVTAGPGDSSGDGCWRATRS